MKEIRKLIVALFLLLTITGWAKEYKASLFGVKSDGVTLNTKSIQKAIDFICESGGGKLVFYVGRYLTGTIQLKTKVTVELREGAVLVATPSIYDYYGVNGVKALIVADGQDSIGIIGKGVIEGQGLAVMDQINAQIKKGYLQEPVSVAKPALIVMNNCSNITIDEFNLMNACGNVQVYSGCRNLTVSRVTVKSTAVPESKGLVLSGCDTVKLSNIFFETSGKEMESSGTSKNVSVADCKNSVGRKVTAKD